MDVMAAPFEAVEMIGTVTFRRRIDEICRTLLYIKGRGGDDD